MWLSMARSVTDTMLTRFEAFVSGITWVAKYVHYTAKHGKLE